MHYPIVKFPAEKFVPSLPFSLVQIFSDNIFLVCYLCFWSSLFSVCLLLLLDPLLLPSFFFSSSSLTSFLLQLRLCWLPPTAPIQSPNYFQCLPPALWTCYNMPNNSAFCILYFVICILLFVFDILRRHTIVLPAFYRGMQYFLTENSKAHGCRVEAAYNEKWCPV